MDKITFKRDTVHLIALQGARAMVTNVMATLQSTLRSDPISTSGARNIG